MRNIDLIRMLKQYPDDTFIFINGTDIDYDLATDVIKTKLIKKDYIPKTIGKYEYCENGIDAIIIE